MATEPLVREDRFAVMPQTVAPLAALGNPKALADPSGKHETRGAGATKI